MANKSKETKKSSPKSKNATKQKKQSPKDLGKKQLGKTRGGVEYLPVNGYDLAANS